MPLYEFYCTDCRSKFELLTSYETSQAGMVCASCHGQHVRKLLSVFARPSRGDDSSSHGGPTSPFAQGRTITRSSMGLNEALRIRPVIGVEDERAFALADDCLEIVRMR